MNDRDFLKLKPNEANNVALGGSAEECQRLRQLYRAEHAIDIETWKPAPPEESDFIQNFGVWLVLIGAAGAFCSFFFPVGVQTPGLYGIPDEVANLDKIALRHMCMAVSVSLFIGGCALIGAGHVAKAVRIAASRARPS